MLGTAVARFNRNETGARARGSPQDVDTVDPSPSRFDVAPGHVSRRVNMAAPVSRQTLTSAQISKSIPPSGQQFNRVGLCKTTVEGGVHMSHITACRFSFDRIL